MSVQTATAKKQEAFYRYFRIPLLSDERTKELLRRLTALFPVITGVQTERLFLVKTDSKFTARELPRVKQIMSRKDKRRNFSTTSFLEIGQPGWIVEVAPSLHFESSDSTNAVAIMKHAGLPKVKRLEQGRRYKFLTKRNLTDAEKEAITLKLYDWATEAYYPDGIHSFDTDKLPEPLRRIPLLKQGVKALRKFSEDYSQNWDDETLNYLTWLYAEIEKRDPTDAELLYFGNAFSEHSRHHTFNAKLIVDGEEKEFTLMEIVQATNVHSENSVIAFHDNASAISGHKVKLLMPERPDFPSPLKMAEILYHFVCTVETHCHPCLWAAYPGAATGGGGRRRDSSDLGRGGIVIAAGAGFVGGNLNDPAHPLPWEYPEWEYNPLTESPLEFFVNGVKGAFDDGNQFGEPVINGFTESLGFMVGEERWESIKPIMASMGFGGMLDIHKEKNEPQTGWLVIKIGGKGFRIGVGGGNASSHIGGTISAEHDRNSVQRADGEMARKGYNVIKDCILLRERNPIENLSDQGAGGWSNVAFETIRPGGALLQLRAIEVGDPTMSPVEILIAEYQECHCLVIKPENLDVFARIAERRDCPYAVAGVITGDGRAVVVDDDGTKVVDLNLDLLFNKMPQRVIRDDSRELDLKPIQIPANFKTRQAMELTYRLLGVASKEWVTHGVDRSVTGLVVQQQDVGPGQIPLSPYSLITPSAFTHTGVVNAVGKRPTLGLVSPEACARISVADALIKTMLFCRISDRKNIKASANWMLAAKLPGGIAWLYRAAKAMGDFTRMVDLGIDGGKDSLSLATLVKGVMVRSLSTLVITSYVDTEDYRQRLQPYIKRPGESKLAFVDLARGKTRLGGSAYAQTTRQVGNECPDADDPELINTVMDFNQELIEKGLLASAHRRGRGGLASTLPEMAFAGNCGLEVALTHPNAGEIEMLMNEELGYVIEYLPEHEASIRRYFQANGVEDIFHVIGQTTKEHRIQINFNGRQIVDEEMEVLRDLWRDTSFAMKKHFAVHSVVDEERRNLYRRAGARYHLSFDPDRYSPVTIDYPGKTPVAVISEEGSNSFEEAYAALYLAGFQPIDVTMSDIRSGRFSLKHVRGIVFVGGFANKDVLGSAVGFAAGIEYNQIAKQEFAAFFSRPDTFSLGICNGCQLMNLLGITAERIPEDKQPGLDFNLSERFEARFPSTRILKSPSIWLTGMDGSILGIHNAHGEGRFYFPDEQVLERILQNNLAPIRFVDDYGAVTEDYPYNPNGSRLGIVALCDPSGRHLEFMDHPERTVMPYQWHYWPNEWSRIQNSPWLRMFVNARLWCEQTRHLDQTDYNFNYTLVA